MLTIDKQLKKILIINIIGLFCMLLLSTKIGFLINRSDSLANKVYFLVKKQKFNKGDFVGIDNLKTTFIERVHFTKKVAGIPGDHIAIKDNWVLINGTPCALIKNKTRDGRKLTPISAQVIPKEHFFVIAEHKDSFDSRYEEFGLVADEYIEGKAYPLW